jgi:hypothetical protein
MHDALVHNACARTQSCSDADDGRSRHYIVSMKQLKCGKIVGSELVKFHICRVLTLPTF